MECVLDCSVALAWVLPDEGSKYADRLLSKLGGKSLFWVPALWWYELANALTIAGRRKRISESDLLHSIEIYGELPIQTDYELSFDKVLRFNMIAQKYSLSAYDAAYLELAQRRGIGLATIDQNLVRAAKKTGIVIA